MPKCTFKKSAGESRIEEWLEANGIRYEPQYRFDDCRNILPLPFDFALLKNEEVVKVIEFDGQQHFSAVSGIWGSSDSTSHERLLKTQNNDRIKNEYCEDNNLSLLRIPYYDINKIEKILSYEIKQIKL